MLTDSSEENRATAVTFLAKAGTPEALQLLQPAFQSSSEKIRYSAAEGLLGNKSQEILDLIVPLLKDESFYVRRAAAMTAISLHYKPAIGVLIDTFNIPTLDTEENYGSNLFNTLAKYTGVNFGLDIQKWRSWWETSNETFEFPN